MKCGETGESRFYTFSGGGHYELASVLVTRKRKPWVHEWLPQFREIFEIGEKYKAGWTFEHRLLKPRSRPSTSSAECEKQAFANMRKPTWWSLSVRPNGDLKDTSAIPAKPICRDDLQFLSLEAELEAAAMSATLTGAPASWSATV